MFFPDVRTVGLNRQKFYCDPNITRLKAFSLAVFAADDVHKNFGLLAPPFFFRGRWTFSFLSYTGSCETKFCANRCPPDAGRLPEDGAGEVIDGFFSFGKNPTDTKEIEQSGYRIRLMRRDEKHRLESNKPMTSAICFCRYETTLSFLFSSHN